MGSEQEGDRVTESAPNQLICELRSFFRDHVTEEKWLLAPSRRIGQQWLDAVARAVGRRRAMEMLLTGHTVDAETALDWGLVNRVVPMAQLDAEVDALARSIAVRSAPVVANGKRSFYVQVDASLELAYTVAGEAMVRDLSGPDAKEGIDAFVGKRTPVWPSSAGA